MLRLLLLCVALTGCSRVQSAPNPEQGRELFAQTCARCHGADGAGGLATAGIKPRNLRDPDFQRARTDEALRAVIRGGKGGQMPPFGQVLRPEQIDALVAYLRTLTSDSSKRPVP